MSLLSAAGLETLLRRQEEERARRQQELTETRTQVADAVRRECEHLDAMPVLRPSA